MTENEDPFEARKGMTFAEAEGAVPLPAQLKPKEVSPELRAVLWRLVYDSLLKHREYPSMGGRPYFKDPWRGILRKIHVYRNHRMADEFVENADKQILETKEIFLKGDYIKIFGWLQDVIRNNPPYGFADLVDRALIYCRAPYRVLDERTIVPVGSEMEFDSLVRAFADLAAAEFHGARSHLKTAAEMLTAGKWADSIRESIHSVESVARVLDGSGEFSRSLSRLENSVRIHTSMKQGFKNLYGYTNDEKGIRHPLLDDGTANVDETDALFMIGACASFVTYLINKSRTAGLI